MGGKSIACSQLSTVDRTQGPAHRRRRARNRGGDHPRRGGRRVGGLSLLTGLILKRPGEHKRVFAEKRTRTTLASKKANGWCSRRCIQRFNRLILPRRRFRLSVEIRRAHHLRGWVEVRRKGLGAFRGCCECSELLCSSYPNAHHDPPRTRRANNSASVDASPLSAQTLISPS